MIGALKDEMNKSLKSMKIQTVEEIELFKT